MPDSSIIRLIKSITDSLPARISLSTISGETVHLDCIYKEGIAPRFFLIFPPKKLPEKINTAQYCSISIRNHDEDTAPLSLSAKVEEIVGDRTLELVAKSSIDPMTLREFFRVNIQIPITIGFQPESNDDSARRWTMTGETLDVSGSGILALFDEECLNSQRLTISFDLPSPQVSISCIGHAVYTRRVRKGRWHIALHFDEIEAKHRDMIISNCLYEQRKQLRESLQPLS